MDYIRKDEMHQYLKDMVKDKNELLKVIDIIGDECQNFGMVVSIEDKFSKEHSAEQKAEMTKAIFENKVILEQLEASELDNEDEDVINVEQMMKFVRKQQNNENK
ncbi:hypothetical protein [Niallia sp.]|uniref:hypothetical protein n=1 Tax=Niallia sp. TaxID=2837523 RepID=UPI00289CDA15|nr:hypothetical protein [Niallia sp.]